MPERIQLEPFQFIREPASFFGRGLQGPVPGRASVTDMVINRYAFAIPALPVAGGQGGRLRQRKIAWTLALDDCSGTHMILCSHEDIAIGGQLFQPMRFLLIARDDDPVSVRGVEEAAQPQRLYL